jgi:hypothetical protein
MQAVLVVLAIAGSTAWLAVDASKRDWSDNGFAKNVPTWVIGSLLLWPIVLPLYVFSHRKKAPLLAAPEPAPAAAMSAAEPAEQYGPSLDEVEHEEPAVEIEPEPEPIVEISQPDPEPTVEILHEPAIEPEPDPVEPDPEPDPVEPDPEPEPAIEVGHEANEVLEISYPETDDAPPGLAVDAFKDIKPVAFGGIVVEETERTPEPEPAVEVYPEPIVEADFVRDVEPLTYPGAEDVPPVKPEIQAEPEPAFAPEPAFEPFPFEQEPEMAAAVAEPVVEEAKPKKRGFRIPNPELKLPSFSKKKVKAEPSAKAEPRSKGGLTLPHITLPANLQGPLSEVERKIALGCVLAIVAAGALGYKTAPSDDAGTLAPTPAPAASSR